MQLTSGDVVLIVLAVLSFIGALSGLLYRHLLNTIKELKDSNELLKAQVAAKLDNTAYNETTARIFTRIEGVEKETRATEKELRGCLQDLELTTVQFGNVYITRKEFESFRDNGRKAG